MNRRYLFIALGLLIAVNALVLAGVAHNRSGEPDAELTLTERELPLAWKSYHDENTGVSLALNVNYDSQSLAWFDAAKLEELGFDTHSIKEGTHRRVYRALPKKVYVVLEYDGEAWRQYRQRQLEEIAALPDKVRQGKLDGKAAENQEREKRFSLGVASRLFCVDVGRDPKILRHRYPDRGRYIVMPALVRMYSNWIPNASGEKGDWRLRGHLEQMLVDRLHVPRDLAAQLQSLPGRSRIQPGYTYFNPKEPARVRYQVRIAVGRRFEPWIEGIGLLAPEAEGTQNGTAE